MLYHALKQDILPCVFLYSCYYITFLCDWFHWR